MRTRRVSLEGAEPAGVPGLRLGASRVVFFLPRQVETGRSGGHGCGSVWKRAAGVFRCHRRWPAETEPEWCELARGEEGKGTESRSQSGPGHTCSASPLGCGGCGAGGRALGPPAWEERAFPPHGRADLREGRPPGRWWLPARVAARGEGTRVTRGAGLCRGTRSLDFDDGKSLPRPCPAGPTRQPAKGPSPRLQLPGWAPWFPQSYPLVVACRDSRAPKVVFVPRPRRAGGRGRAKEWRGPA